MDRWNVEIVPDQTLLKGFGAGQLLTYQGRRVSSSPTKSVRVRLTSALRSGFREQGWGKKTVLFPMDVAPPGWVEDPLEVLVSTEVEAAKYGGVSLSS